ncbi:transposase [Kocuria carniphila]|uniref:Transposase n=2 Tax=Kocuria carniphila TaxID=262208 RepID=A0ABV3V6G0_9MICC
MLLRHGIVYDGGQAWTGAHHAWLARQYLESPATRMAFDAEHETVLVTAARRDRLDQEITKMAAESQFAEVVHRLGCLRGISTLTGFGLAVEIGDWHRFTGDTIGAFVGLVPSEYSSGASRAQGPDTQDRQHPRQAAAGRSRLAPPPGLPHRQDHARSLGPGTGGRSGPRRCR